MNRMESSTLVDRSTLVDVVKAALGYGLVALLGVWLIRDAGWSPMATLTLLIGLFVVTLAVMVIGGKELAFRRLETVPAYYPVRAERSSWGRVYRVR